MPRILVAPLDWGMGHTTRCICIVKALQLAGANVIIACNPLQQAFLENEVTDVEFLTLNGYNISYAKNFLLTSLKIAGQIPKILASIKAENKWLQTVINSHKIDAVISDNRFGLYSNKVPCVFITHQLYIQSSIGKKFIEILNFRFINKFTRCWVPDTADWKDNLSGILSHTKLATLNNVDYLNPISRLDVCTNISSKKQLLLILSGPEPQRSILLKNVATQMLSLPEIQCIVAGNSSIKTTNKNIKHLGNVNSLELQNLICESEFIVTRSGYTSIMDLAKLNKHALLIPTPGQTEQIYLGKYMAEKKWHITQTQNNIDLKAYILSKENYNAYPNFDFKNHVQVINTWVRNLGKP